MRLKFLACEVMQAELLAEPSGHQITWDWVSMGLHTHPAKLHQELQARLETSLGFDAVVMAFGLCGGAARGLVSPHCPLILPRTHDCETAADPGPVRQRSREWADRLGLRHETLGADRSYLRGLVDDTRIGDPAVDLGRDVPPQVFVDQAVAHNAQIIGISTLMTTTMPGMAKVIDLLKAQGLRDRFRVIVGGGPLSQTYADKIGADGYSSNAPEAVKLARRLVLAPRANAS